MYDTPRSFETAQCAEIICTSQKDHMYNTLRSDVQVAAQAPQSLAPLTAVALDVAVLALEALQAATGGFASEREIGSGGFGKVFYAGAISSLPPARRLCQLAVKRANAGLELADLAGEVKLLQVRMMRYDMADLDLT